MSFNISWKYNFSVKNTVFVVLKYVLELSKPRGVLRFELVRGVPLEPQNPYPSLRVILAEKGTHF